MFATYSTSKHVRFASYNYKVYEISLSWVFMNYIYWFSYSPNRESFYFYCYASSSNIRIYFFSKSTSPLYFLTLFLSSYLSETATLVDSTSIY